MSVKPNALNDFIKRKVFYSILSNVKIYSKTISESLLFNKILTSKMTAPERNNPEIW